MYHVSVHSPSRLGSRAAEQGPKTTVSPLTRNSRCARISTSPRIRLRPKAGFSGQERGEVTQKHPAF